MNMNLINVEWIAIVFGICGGIISLISGIVTIDFGIKLYRHHSSLIIRICSIISTTSFTIASFLYSFFAPASIITNEAKWTQKLIVILPRIFLAVAFYLILIITYQRLQLTLKTSEFPISKSVKLYLNILFVIIFFSAFIVSFGTLYKPKLIPYLLGPALLLVIITIISILSLFINRLIKVMLFIVYCILII